MTFELTAKTLDHRVTRRRVLHPIHVICIEEHDSGCTVTLSTGETFEVTEGLDHARTLWQIAMIDLQSLSQWDPASEDDDDADHASDDEPAGDLLDECLS